MLYRCFIYHLLKKNMYFSLLNLLNYDFDLEFKIYSFNWEHLTTKVVKRILKFVIQSTFNLLFNQNSIKLITIIVWL